MIKKGQVLNDVTLNAAFMSKSENNSILGSLTTSQGISAGSLTVTGSGITTLGGNTGIGGTPGSYRLDVFGTMRISSQITSTLVTGNSPFVVASTTKVANLNAEYLDDQHGAYYLDWTNFTNKPDPVITLAGDLSGSVTLTDMASGTLTATVLDDSHNHTATTLPYISAIARQTMTGTTTSNAFYAFAQTAIDPNDYSGIFKVTCKGTSNTSIMSIQWITVAGYQASAPIITITSKQNSTTAASTGVYLVRVVYPKTAGNGYAAFLELQAYDATSRDITVELIEAKNLTLMSSLTATTYNSTYHNTQSRAVNDNAFFLTSNFIGGYFSGTASQTYNVYNDNYTAGEALVTNDIIFLQTDNKWYKANIASRTIPLGTMIGRCNGNYAIGATCGVQTIIRTTMPTGITSIVGSDIYIRGSISGGVFTTDGTIASSLAAGYSYIRIGSCVNSTTTIFYDGNNRVYTVASNGYVSAVEALAIEAHTLDGQHAPTGTIVGTTDSQTLTNKTMGTTNFTGGIVSNYSNAAIELGNTTAANTAYIDFHSSGNAIDYDSRIIATGGDASIGNGLIRIYAGGLGIGISPEAKLDVASNTTSNSTATIRIPRTVTQSQFLVFRTGTVTDFAMGRKASSDIFQMGHWAGSGDYLANLAINTAGNVGVGTDSPSFPLDVYKDSDVWHASFGGASGELRIGGQHNLGAVIQAVRISDGTARDIFLQRDGGNVGIRTAYPITKFQVGNKIVDDSSYSYDPETAYLIHQTATSATVLNDPKAVLLLGRQGTGGQAYGAGAAFSLSRYENNGTNARTRLDLSLAHGAFDIANNVMTALSSGNVGFGYTDPTERITVNGAISVSKKYKMQYNSTDDSLDFIYS